MTDAADEQAAWLERIRRSGIRVDREGRFVHDGAEVTHEGLKRALFRWFDRLPPPDARYVLRLDEQRTLAAPWRRLDHCRRDQHDRQQPLGARPGPGPGYTLA